MDAVELKGVPLFDGLSKKELERVAHWADLVEVPAGYHLLNQGSLPHEFFVILEGTADVERLGERIAGLGPGDFFGEIALVEDDLRTATVVSASPMTLAVMTTREFDSVRHEFPAVGGRIEAAVRARQQR
jgi:CRP/FNR family cyclic AMP-dependent transcriptional regulator